MPHARHAKQSWWTGLSDAHCSHVTCIQRWRCCKRIDAIALTRSDILRHRLHPSGWDGGLDSKGDTCCNRFDFVSDHVASGWRDSDLEKSLLTGTTGKASHTPFHCELCRSKYNTVSHACVNYNIIPVGGGDCCLLTFVSLHVQYMQK